MLALSRATFQQLSRPHEQPFIHLVIQSLHEELPDQASAVGTEGLMMLVQQGVAIAEQWMIDDEEAIGLMCALGLCCGCDLFTDKTVKDYILWGNDPLQRIHDLIDEIDDLDAA